MNVIKLRGLPWSCTVEDVVKFLSGIKIALKSSETDTKSPSVYLTSNAEGRPSGEAFVELVDESDAEAALKRNNAMMGQRYIEVFRSNQEQLSKHIQESWSSTTNWSEPVVRLRGLPFGCHKEDIASFFAGQNQNATIPSLMENLSDNQQFGYSKSVSFGSNSRRTGFGVRLRGLPYSVNEVQIRDFFKPLIPVNVVLSRGRDGRPSGECEVDFENQNLTNEALKFDKKYIGNRYIEIFALNSGAKVQNSMSIDTLMKQDFGNKNAGSNGNLSNDLNGNGYVPFESGVNPMPVPPPPPLMNQQNSMGSLLGPIPSLNQMGNSNMNEIIFADMAKQMTQLYCQFQSQQQFIAGMNMMQANGANVPSSMNRRF